MASATIVPSRALLEALSPIRHRPICQCFRTSQARRRGVTLAQRNASTTTAQRSEMEVEGEPRPRWSQTPPAMKAPVSTLNRAPGWKPIVCNSDPVKLDDMYIRFLGPNGDKLLSDETKWLAITHKSFDFGRRGFNDRLAYLGKRIVEVQTSLALLNTAETAAREQGSLQKADENLDPYGREHFSHPAIDNIGILASDGRDYRLHHKVIAAVAQRYQIAPVIRWWPRDRDNLAISGRDLVYAQTVFAIIGALALERGSAVANQITREKIIPFLRPRSATKRIADSSDT